MSSIFNLSALVRTNVLRLKPYSSARDEFKDFEQEMVFLDANENPFENGVNRYPDPQQRALKKALAEQKDVLTENILLGNGSDEVLDLIFRAFCEPKTDNIITLPPTYGMYGVLSEINAVENREVLLLENFQPEVSEVIKKIDTQSKILFICSPNNPTANAFDADKIEKMIVRFPGLVVIDEAYIDFSEKESWLARLNDFPNLIVTQTLSKAYGMAGIRLGICYASAEIIAVLNKIKPPYNVNKLTQIKAMERVLDVAGVQQEVKRILQERNILLEALKKIEFVKKIYPTDANFVLIRVDDSAKRYTQLLEKGIVTRIRSSQPLCQNTLRITIGTSAENKKLITALNQMN
ncbi:MAG: histidinol-phosphate transaminase [Flavobacteriales bacterium CG_4_9_14_3_um_filter_40_17]|nr:MAG: histidinol-phosphate transaminase [Flavobacteriales bacterium CG_4_9_14_3_um_filter_40_17]